MRIKERKGNREENMNHKKDKHKKDSHRYKIDDPIFTMQEYDLDYENNEIYLIGAREYSAGTGSDGDEEPGVEHIMAGRFIKNLQTLIKKKGDDPILIHMKTCGGHWAEGMAIYDAIRLCPKHVTILSYTHARSMSSLIFLAAHRRIMMPHSTFMFHEGTMFGGGTVKQYLTEAVEVKKAGDQMLGVYIDNLKQQGSKKSWSRKRLKEWLIKEMAYKEEVYFDSKEAVKIGFADEVFDGDWDNLKGKKNKGEE
jgi:ATP-dependent protease ClpP protease subunit